MFIYSCSAEIISFEIVCFYNLGTRIYEYVPSPNHGSSGASDPNQTLLYREWQA
jgi:hypothetical protein